MLRKESEDLAKITTSVYATDWEWLKETFTKTGASKALRDVLRAFRKKKEKEILAAKAKIKTDDVEVEI